MGNYRNNNRNNNNNNGNNNNGNNLGVDYTQGGAITIIPDNSLNAMLYNAQNQGQQYQQPSTQLAPVYQSSQPLTVEQAYAQPTEVRHVYAKPITKPSVPDIEIPYTEVWKASRLHPQNPRRYFWYPYYTILTFISSPVGICITATLILLGTVNFLLNGSYQGPGYASGRKIEVIPKELPKFATPVVDVVE